MQTRKRNNNNTDPGIHGHLQLDSFKGCKIAKLKIIKGFNTGIY